MIVYSVVKSCKDIRYGWCFSDGYVAGSDKQYISLRVCTDCRHLSPKTHMGILAVEEILEMHAPATLVVNHSMTLQRYHFDLISITRARK